MLKTITTFLLLLFCSHIMAQFDSAHHYRFRFGSQGSLNKTNDSKAYLLNNGLNFDIKQPKILFTSNANWIYGAQNHLLTNNDFISIANLDFGKGKTALYEWGLVNYQTSYSLNIIYKMQAGGGFGFTILDSPKAHLSVSDGFLYEANNLTDATRGKDLYNTVRNSFRLRYRFNLKDIIVFNGTDFVQPSILSINDYILNFNNDVAIKLRKWLSLNTTLTYNRINRIGTENLYLSFGIGIDKYF